MNKIALSIAACGLALMSSLFAAPAHAQATRTWVSGVGDDVNPCSRTAPCKTFAGAISKTAAGGEINCIDPGGYGTVTITKSMTIDCIGTDGSILGAGTNGVNINDSASGTPNTAVVNLRNLTIQGAVTGFVGVNFVSGASVHIENCFISGFAGSATGGGIKLATSAGSPELFVSNTVVTRNGSSGSTGGLVVVPTGGTVRLSLDRLKVSDNSAGILVNGPVSGSIHGELRDSVVAGNTNNGITTNSNGASVTLMVDNVSVTSNAFGLVASGTTSGMLVGRSTLVDNATAISATAPSNVLSYGDNLVNGNPAGETFSGSVLPKK